MNTQGKHGEKEEKRASIKWRKRRSRKCGDHGCPSWQGVLGKRGKEVTKTALCTYCAGGLTITPKES